MAGSSGPQTPAGSAELQSPAASSAPRSSAGISPDDRVVVYALTEAAAAEHRHVAIALTAFCEIAGRIILLRPGVDTPGPALAELVDQTIATSGERFDPADYALALDAVDGAAEVVFTGDRWFGPIASPGTDASFAPVVERMDAVDVDAWELVERIGAPRRVFPEQGFPAVSEPWPWLAVRGRALRSAAWRAVWSADGESAEQQRVVAGLRARGLRTDAAFDVADFPLPDPALFCAEQLLDEGCPVVDRAVFTSYPVFLDRHAIIGREILQTLGELGYPTDAVWDALVRTTAPRTLYANLGMLEVLPDVDTAYDPERPLRIAALVHVGDLDELDEILLRLGYLPGAVDIFATTTKGASASIIERRLETWVDGTDRKYEVRVTPANNGRDMSDLFVASRDIIRGDRYDLVVKLHSRHAWWKSVNRRRYFRRYQLENLLEGPGYARNVVAMFQADPTLGVVFPPMMHIGHGIMGNGWSYLREPAEHVAAELGIRVPFDLVSPHAPYGGMWIARPDALRVLAQRNWTFLDYGKRFERRYRSLARLQERLVAYGAAERGYQSRTVLTTEHAAISHTSLEFKADRLLSTTHGWPIEAIDLLHRAGYTGYGGTVALLRMYIRLHHPRFIDALRPGYRLAYRGYGVLARARRVAGRLTRSSSEEQTR